MALRFAHEYCKLVRFRSKETSVVFVVSLLGTPATGRCGARTTPSSQLARHLLVLGRHLGQLIEVAGLRLELAEGLQPALGAGVSGRGTGSRVLFVPEAGTNRTPRPLRRPRPAQLRSLPRAQVGGQRCCELAEGWRPPTRARGRSSACAGRGRERPRYGQPRPVRPRSRDAASPAPAARPLLRAKPGQR